MGFALIVEIINIRMRARNTKPVHLHAQYASDDSTPQEK